MNRIAFLLVWIFLMASISFFSTERLKALPSVSPEKFNLNQASFEDLMQVPKLQAKVAKRILMERDTKGAFRSIGELEAISGVGPKTIENLLRFSVVK